MFQSVIDDFPPVRNRRPVWICLWECYRDGNQAARCSGYDRISGPSYNIQRDLGEGAKVLGGILLTKVGSQELVSCLHHVHNHLVKGLQPWTLCMLKTIPIEQVNHRGDL